METYINSLKTISEVNNYRDMINKECDDRITVIETIKRADDLSNKSFGYIKECFEALSPELFKSVEGKKLLKKYTGIIKESKNLSSMHKINEAVRKAGKGTDADFFTRTISELNWEINKDTIENDVKKLGKVLAEAYIMIGMEESENLLPEENTKLYTAISYIAENGLTKSNIIEHGDAIKIIKESISNKESSDSIFDSKDLDVLTNELLESFNMKYSNELTEEESLVLKEIASSENREEVFNKYKNKCIEKITEAKKEFEKTKDTDSINRLSVILEKVNSKNYCLENIGEDICNLIEISNVF